MSDLLQFVRGCTFDDFLFTPQYSVIERRDPAAIDLSSPLTKHLTLKRPIVSANMDTITRADDGHRPGRRGRHRHHRPRIPRRRYRAAGREVERVKRTQHGIIADPYTIASRGRARPKPPR